MTDSKLYPFAADHSMPAGTYLGIVLDSLDMTQSDLAARTGLSVKHINQVVKHGAAISPGTAAEIEYATGVPAELLAALDAAHQARLARESSEQDLERALNWLSKFNLRELKQRGILENSRRSVANAAVLLRYFGIAEPEGWARVWQPSLTSFRRSPSFRPDAVATTLWLRAGQRRSVGIPTEPFDERGVRSSIHELRGLTVADLEDALPELQSRMATLGVAVVFVAEFDGCRASGATWWASSKKAVVLLSNRGKREDRFWFSFFHELGHILLHAKRDTFLDQNRPDDDGQDGPPWQAPAPSSGFIDDGSRDSELERQADDFAAESLIPSEYLQELASLMSERDVIDLAKKIGVSAGIVAGRFQYETGQYNRFNDLRRSIPNTLFDRVV